MKVKIIGCFTLKTTIYLKQSLSVVNATADNLQFP